MSLVERGIVVLDLGIDCSGVIDENLRRHARIGFFRIREQVPDFMKAWSSSSHSWSIEVPPEKFLQGLEGAMKTTKFGVLGDGGEIKEKMRRFSIVGELRGE